MKLENTISNLKYEIQKLTNVHLDMAKMVQEIPKIKETLPETYFNCDLCDYISNSSKGLKCHVAKIHKIYIVIHIKSQVKM